MRCGICGKMTRELKSDLCFRCYVISRAIRLEPEMPNPSGSIDIKRVNGDQKHSRFTLKAFMTNLRIHENDH